MPGRKYPCTFDELAPAVLCDSVIWLELIHFYVHTAEKSTGAPLKSGPITEYVRKALGLARDKYGKIPEYCDVFPRLRQRIQRRLRELAEGRLSRSRHLQV